MDPKKIIRQRKNKFKTFNLITIDSKRLKSNLKLLQGISAETELIPVLKSNAYGHGIREVAQILEKLKVKMVAVNGYFEARQIYYIFHGKIIVMGAIDPRNVNRPKGRRISYVLQNAKDLQNFARLRRKINVHLELNTGMNRLGLKSEEVSEYLKTMRKNKNLRLEGVMTHLAAADEAENPSPEIQARKFDEIVKKILAEGFEPRYFHVANSAGTGRVKSEFANAARVGIGLYGINNLEKSDGRFDEFEKLQPVLELKSTIVKIIDLKKGDQVGYGGSFVAPAKMRIGVLPLGYYEGIPRELSNRGVVSFGEKYLPIVGRVCMNHTMIDISETNLQEGNEVVIISKEPKTKNSVIDMQREFDLFSYENLTRLSGHVRRKIV